MIYMIYYRGGSGDDFLISLYSLYIENPLTVPLKGDFILNNVPGPYDPMIV